MPNVMSVTDLASNWAKIAGDRAVPYINGLPGGKVAFYELQMLLRALREGKKHRDHHCNS